MPTTAAAACRLFLITNWWLPKLEIGYRYYGYSGYSAGVWAQTVKLSSLFLYHTACLFGPSWTSCHQTFQTSFSGGLSTLCRYDTPPYLNEFKLGILINIPSKHVGLRTYC